jgi:hypothetical protein
MASDDDVAQRRAMESLDRLMQSGSPREARDAVADTPVLLDPFFSDRLGEMANRLRQLGEVQSAEAVEHWQRVLQRFRELGLQEGYLEFVMDELFRATTGEQHTRILLENPDLRDPATSVFIARRAAESATSGDTIGEAKYVMAKAIIDSAQVSDLKTEGPALDDVVNAFYSGFVREPDPVANRHLLEARPDLLELPTSLIVASMFQPEIAAAQAANDLVTLRSLLRRQRLFQRCQEVGIVRAFDELARGVRWPEPSST